MSGLAIIHRGVIMSVRSCNHTSPDVGMCGVKRKWGSEEEMGVGSLFAPRSTGVKITTITTADDTPAVRRLGN